MFPRREFVRFQVVLLMTLSCFGVSPAVLGDDTAASESHASLLWVGASSTYFHSMPEQMGEWLTTRGVFDSVETALVGRGGTSIHVYLQPDFVAGYGLEPGERVLDLIRKRHHDAVILQITCSRLASEMNEDLQGAIDTYCAAVRKAGGERFTFDQICYFM